MSVAAAMAAALGMLSGCSASTPTSSMPAPTASPAPLPTPVFTSDADALAAAKKAYTAYLKVSDEILNEGGVHPERLKKVAGGKALKQDLKGIAEERQKERHATGRSELQSIRLQSKDLSGSSKSITAYACVSEAKSDMLDRSGKSVVTPNSPTLFSLVITFRSREHDAQSLLVTRSVSWRGEPICG